MNAARSTAALAILLAAAGCALGSRPVGEVLEATRDDRCGEAVAAFRAAPQDAAAALHAARVLFESADVSVQQAFVTAERELERPTVDALLAAEVDLPGAIRERVLALATAGIEAAEAVLANDPTPAQRVDAEVHLALHLTFVAWANGIVRSLMAGYGGRITTAMAAAMALDPLWDHGAPLRLEGRFRAQAPWPLGDRDKARQLLQRAVEVAPLPIHHLFLGDLQWQAGENDAAVAQWRAVLDAVADATTAAVAPWHRELAAMRIAAADGAAAATTR